MDYQNRAAPCSHCGDKVLIAVRQPLGLPGMKGRYLATSSESRSTGRRGSANRLRLEHADPSLDGVVFDGVDEDCRRAPVRPGFPL